LMSLRLVGMSAAVGPVPGRDRADRVQVGVASGPGVLLGHVRAELDVLLDRLPERRVCRQSGLVECVQVHRHEPVALLIGDLQVPVHVDEVPEPELAGEAVGSAEGLRGEPGQVVDMRRQALVTARVLVERLVRTGMLSQQAGPPPTEAVGEPVVIDGVQARDVIVDVMDVQRD